MGKKEKENVTPPEELEVNSEYERLEVEKISTKKTKLNTIDSVSKEDLKTFVKLYYETQRLRNITSNFVKDADDENVIEKAFLQDAVDYRIIENNIKNQLEAICQSQEVGRWLLGITGIGPALAAGLLANFDVTKAHYASNFTSYAGLADHDRPWLGVEKSRNILNDILDGRTTITDDDVIEYSSKVKWKYETLYAAAYNESTGKWSKTNLIKAAAKIPYNKELKSFMYNVGCSFEYQKSRPQSLYGRILRERLTYENMMNDRGKYADQARAKIENGSIGKDTEAYKSYIEGRLPDAQIRLRALKYTEKIFLNHLFVEMYRVEYGVNPPNPYIIDHSNGEHNVIIPPEVPYTPIKEDNNSYADMDTFEFFKHEYAEYLTDEEMKDLEQVKKDLDLKVKSRKAKKQISKK